MTDSPRLWRTQKAGGEALIFGKWLNQQNSEDGKLTSEAKSFILRSIPEPLCYGFILWIGEVEDDKSIDDLITSASIIGDLILDFENLDFKIASGLRSQQPKAKLNQGRAHSQADRLLG